MYLRPADQCDCETCPGHSPPNPDPDVCGGWMCSCQCHKERLKAKTEAERILIALEKKEWLNAEVYAGQCRQMLERAREIGEAKK